MHNWMWFDWIFISKSNKKKIIFFYHPRKLTVRIHTFYVEDLLKEFHPNTIIIYGYEDIKSLGKNYFFIKKECIIYQNNYSKGC